MTPAKIFLQFKNGNNWRYELFVFCIKRKVWNLLRKKRIEFEFA